MNARTFDTDGAKNYLDVRYSEAARPYTRYPDQLTQYLSERYLRGLAGKALLDLGCGRGEFLHGFARQGFDACGVDRSRPGEPKFSEPVTVCDYEKTRCLSKIGASPCCFRSRCSSTCPTSDHYCASVNACSRRAAS